jgi:1-acyl-sn-glycerol-3-phosphate acyltransferase
MGAKLEFNMLNRIISISFLLFLAISSVFLFILALTIWFFTVLFDRRLIILHQFSSFWASIYLWVMPAWSVSIEGRNKIKKGITYMIVSNHQSQLDILVAFRLFFHFKWVSKAEVFKLPFIGWNMALNRYIKLKRGSKGSMQKMLAECEKALSDGNSVYFFPEGTRSKTGIIKPFKPGAFILAKKMMVPILPIAINGTKNALPKHSLNFHGKHKIKVKVLDAIQYESFADLPVNEICKLVRNRIAECIDEHKEIGQ